jgi:molybdate/tungstate transport system permease protein
MKIKASNYSNFEIALSLLGSLVVLLVIAPLLGLLLASSLGELSDTLVDFEVLDSIQLTLSAALAATILCTITGIPLAYLLARKEFWGKTFLLAIIDLPIIIPHAVAGIALLSILGRQSLMTSIFGDFIGSFKGIMIAMAFVSVPFLINAARAGFMAVPQRLEKVARTLGASPTRVFFTISLPMAWRDILSGMVLMWARGISEFGAVLIIAYYPMTTPVLIYERFNDFGLSYARAAAVLLVVICIAIFVLLRIVSRKRKPAEERHA